MQHNSLKQQLGNLKFLSTQELKALLSKLQQEHDILQAQNDDLTNQISDLRQAVKCVQSQRKQTISFQLQSKKQLEDKMDSLEKGIKQALKNNHYQAMQGFKALHQ